MTDLTAAATRRFAYLENAVMAREMYRLTRISNPSIHRYAGAYGAARTRGS